MRILASTLFLLCLLNSGLAASAQEAIPTLQIPPEPNPEPENVSALKPILREQSEPASPPSGTRPQPTPSITIDAEQIYVPPRGMASLLPRTDLVPEPFCEINPTKRIDESGNIEPRCCHEQESERSHSTEAAYSADHHTVASAESGRRLTAVFAEAAHFSTGSCDGGPGCSGQPPIVLYEGMSVTVDMNGCYEVRAMLDGPRIPAILRLQLTGRYR